MCSDPKGPAKSLAAALTLCLLAAGVVGCGKKGAPLPPLRVVPLQTKDLQVRQQGRMVLLEMTYPSTTQSGQALGGVDAVELHVLAKPAQADGAPPSVEPREFEAGAELLLTLRGTELESAITGDRIGFRLPLADPLPQPPVGNVFAVRTLKGDEVSDFSNRVSLVPREPPAPPSNLQVEARPNSILLTWESDEEAEGFDIFRRRAQDRAYGGSLRRVPGDARRLLDSSARYGERYIYTVRTVAGTRPLIHSEPAGEREIEYEDRFPPPLPKNFVALAETGAIRLRWDPSGADDVAGYILYRRDPRRSEFVRITPEPVVGTEYLDRGLASGLSFEYRLQAIDRLGNESRQSRPISATTR